MAEYCLLEVYFVEEEFLEKLEKILELIPMLALRMQEEYLASLLEKLEFVEEAERIHFILNLFRYFYAPLVLLVEYSQYFLILVSYRPQKK